MPELTRRPIADIHRKGWHVYYGDVRVGQIVQRTGNPDGTDPWQWHCGFYPGLGPGQDTDGTAWTVDDARAQFQVAWNRLLPSLVEANFDEWRYFRDFTAWKYRMWDE